MNIKKIISIAVIILLGIILIFNLVRNEDKNIKIIKGEEQQVVEADYIYSHPESISFPAVVRSSGKKPVETEYKGMEMSKLFSALNIDIWSVNKITFNAIDGYKIILDVDEIKEPNNVFLAFQRDGQLLKSKKKGGSGPFQLVIRQDSFSQRWIKHVNEIILE